MTILKTMGLLLVSIFGLNACVATNSNYSNGSSYNTYEPVVKPSFVSEKWFLTKINNLPYKGQRITLNLSSQKKASGFSGCNRYFISDVKVNGNQLKFSSIGSTKKLCVDYNSNQLERRYLDALRDTTHFEKNNNRLVLTGSSSSLVFYKRSAR